MIFLTCVPVVIFMYFYEVGNLCSTNNTYSFRCYVTFENAYTLILSFTLLSLPLLLTLPFDKLVFLRWFKFASVAIPLLLIYIYYAITVVETDWLGINYKMIFALFACLAYILISLGVIIYTAYGIKRGKIKVEDGPIEKPLLVKRLKRKAFIWFLVAIFLQVPSVVISVTGLCPIIDPSGYNCDYFIIGLSEVALLLLILLIPLLLSFRLGDVIYLYLYKFTVYSSPLIMLYGSFVFKVFSRSDRNYYDSDYQYWYLMAVVLIYYFAFLLIYFSKKKSEQDILNQ